MPVKANSDHRRLRPSGFEENKGQVVTTLGEQAPYVKYRLTDGNTSIFLLDAGVAYQFNRALAPVKPSEVKEDRPGSPDPRGKAGLESCRMDMTLEGADPHARISTTGRSSDYTHYYNHRGAGSGQAVLDVRTFHQVTYHDVYPGIDWVVRTADRGIEYDFVLRPHADPGLIRMRFSGHTELYLDDEGRLVHGNRLGRFTEDRPIGFQGDRAIPAEFVLDGAVLRFGLGDYDHDEPLVIDPPRAWATYYGGPDVDLIRAVATDTIGNVYAVGMTRSNAGISSVVVDSVFNGEYADDDAMLIKFDTFGARVWGIYYGWVQFDEFNAAAVDGVGNIYCAGATSSNAYIATWGAQQYLAGGNADDPTYDAMLVKFRPDGTLIWGTFYGGAGEDRANSVSVDQSGRVFIAGQTSSGNSNSIAISGHQNTFGSGDHDAFLAKFNANGIRQWGTYYGGLADDLGRGCATDPSGNIYLTGITNSANGIAALGSHQSANAGSYDGFLVKFNTNGTRIWATYYGGTDADTSSTCAVDLSGDVYMAGSTRSSNGIAVDSAHQPAFNGGGGDAFLVKFNSAGERQWGTYYGGPSIDFGRDCAIGPDSNITICGTTSSSVAIASPGSQYVFAGVRDAFFANWTPQGQLVFGSYYGGSIGDVGLGCDVNRFGDIFLCGSTSSTDTIAANGTYAPAHQDSLDPDPQNPGDGFLVKFGDTIVDCQGVPGGPMMPGLPCDDGDSCTNSDTINPACLCAGVFLDNDNDGVPDCFDVCSGPDPGQPCDDLDTLTVNDLVLDDCSCIGTAVTCIVSADCHDQVICTLDECMGTTCVYTPYLIGSISGTSSVSGWTTHTYAITPAPLATGYSWEPLPPGWTSDDTAQPQLVATAGGNGGTATLCVTVSFGGCALDTCLNVEVAVGLEDHGTISAPAFSVSPNPSAGLFTLSVNSPSAGGTTFELHDTAGRLVGVPRIAAGQTTTLLELSDLSPGMYLLRMMHQHGTRPVKLMIDR